jgi:HEXXH motif-containing protein
MTATFRLPAAQFAALASGHGGPPAVGLLRSAQLSKQLLLVRAVVRSRLPHDSRLRQALAVLSAAQRRAPQAVARILSRSWLTACMAACIRGAAGGPGPAALGYLGAIAAVAARCAGLDADVEARVADGRVVLPTLGVALVQAPAGGLARIVVRNGTVRVRHEAGQVRVPAIPSQDGEGWLGLRRLDVVAQGRRLVLRLDDLDPYRDCYARPLARRLPAAEVAHWRELLRGAWETLVRHLPQRAQELSLGLHTMVPVAEGVEDAGLSATSRDAFGAFALNRPRSAGALAATLVHEFQHSKLNAVNDLVRLYEGSGTRGYYAPWRPDPRPVGALLQGTYAFLGVTDVWRELSRPRPDGGPNDYPAVHAELGEQVALALRQLATAVELTAAGRRFVAGMRAALEQMTGDIPDPIRAGARRSALAGRVAWRLRHRDADGGEVSAIARAFLRTWAADAVAAPRGGAPAALDDEAWSHRLSTAASGPLFDRPELVVAVYREIQARTGRAPDPGRLTDWFTRAGPG